MSEFRVAYSVSSWLPVTMTWIYTQIKYLRDFSPLILTETTDGLNRLPSYQVCAIPNRLKRKLLQNLYKNGIRIIPKVYHDALKEFRPAVLHSHFGDRGWYDLPMAQRYGLRQVVTYYGYDLSRLPAKRPVWRKRYQQLFEYASLFLLEGEYMANTLTELGCPRDKIRVQRLGIDLEEIPFKPRVLGDNETLRVLIAGRFMEKKGIPDAMRAIGILRQQYPEIEVTVIGDSNGSRRGEKEKARIHEAIRVNQLEAVVKLLGFQPFQVLMEQAYRHHIFLSPSVVASDGDTEGGVPISIIEMLASGMMVVSTHHCDIPGVIQHGVSGMLAGERRPEELAQHLKWLIEHPQAWPAMLDAGRKHVEQKFNARVQGLRLMAIYEDLVRFNFR